jgi:serine/threonine protein phosphatase PrpC
MRIISAGHTDKGLVRKTNQDSFLLMPQLDLYCVADGMGGHLGGDIASKLACEKLQEFFNNNYKKNNNNDVEVDPKILLKGAVDFCNQSILNYARENPQLKDMGTTMVIMFFYNENLFIANVGDSRAYLVNKNQIYQLTRDHSQVFEKLREKIYSRAQAKNDKKRNILTRAVGIEEKVQCEIFQYKINENDTFFICSDGLHNKVSDRDILYLITKRPLTNISISQCAQELIKYANAHGGQDNSSIILCSYQ